MIIQQIENQESALSVRNKLNQVIDLVNQMGTDVAQKISALEQKAWLFDFFENNLLPDASASGPQRNQQEPDVKFTYTVDISSKTSGQIPRGIRAYANHWVAWIWKDGENFRHRYYALATSDATIKRRFLAGSGKRMVGHLVMIRIIAHGECKKMCLYALPILMELPLYIAIQIASEVILDVQLL